MKFIITEEEKNRIRNLYVESDSQINYDEFDKVIAQAGVSLTPEEKMELSPECPFEIPNTKYNDIINKIKSNLEQMNLSSLTSTLKQVKGLVDKKNQITNEQISSVIIAGVAVPGVAVVVVAGIVMLMILIKIGKLIFGRSSKSNSVCRRRNRLYRKIGSDAWFN